VAVGVPLTRQQQVFVPVGRQATAHARRRRDAKLIAADAAQLQRRAPEGLEPLEPFDGARGRRRGSGWPRLGARIQRFDRGRGFRRVATREGKRREAEAEGKSDRVRHGVDVT